MYGIKEIQQESRVKRFNEIFDDFDNYIADYNRTYVRLQKEKLKAYFDDIEGKQLDDCPFKTLWSMIWNRTDIMVILQFFAILNTMVGLGKVSG